MCVLESEVIDGEDDDVLYSESPTQEDTGLAIVPLPNNDSTSSCKLKDSTHLPGTESYHESTQLVAKLTAKGSTFYFYIWG